ncbi:TonB-dependent siderophore receptor [Marinoscillum sp. MHG1-6]|uniref:TonB-dependent receptor plug domain-containing protein n=1 Tax=Marinoscillum sp. MHG1-6 TaxID=2959627 RepID=UPI002156FF06|nr:TonB-dependent receptor plug domain-containing protein [Marinoscillum sp. MHG1-6]
MRFVLLLTFGLGYGVLLAQTDTTYLDAVEVSGSWYRPFTTGTGVRSVQLADEPQSLDGILTGEPSIYFKTYGNGQLSSIAFRGTTAGHTAVLWHGIPSNYPTLGEMDFSQWPGWFLEDLAVQPGSGGALYGSGAIGGTILLDTDISNTNESSPLSVGLELGSFGRQFTGIKTNYEEGNFYASTNAYWDRLKNNFSFNYQGEKHVQTNASNSNYGLQQKVGYKVRSHKFLLDGMYTFNDREIQPNKSSLSTRNTIETENARIALVHNSHRKSECWNNTVSYLSNSTLFNDSLRTTSRQLSALSIYSWGLSDDIEVRAGGNLNYFEAHSSNYAGEVHDVQGAFFTSLNTRWSTFWETSLNLRQSIYKGRIPFTPSLGNEIQLIVKEHFQLKTYQSASYGFRYPTLNQLYWRPGGKPDLRSETSISLDAGLAAEWDYSSSKLTASATGFGIWSEDWIYWVPLGGISTPQNLRDVRVRGLESQVAWTYKGLMVNHRLIGSYSLNESQNRSGTNVGNQLIYVPLHSGSVSYQLAVAHWIFGADGVYTGRRFTTLNNEMRDSVEPFAVFNLILNYEIELGEHQITLGTQVKNVLNEDYENYNNLAMPGRNYSINVLFKL